MFKDAISTVVGRWKSNWNMPVQVQVTVRRRTRDKAIDGKPHEANYRINITHQYTRVGPGDLFFHTLIAIFSCDSNTMWFYYPSLRGLYTCWIIAFSITENNSTHTFTNDTVFIATSFVNPDDIGQIFTNGAKLCSNIIEFRQWGSRQKTTPVTDTTLALGTSPSSVYILQCVYLCSQGMK